MINENELIGKTVMLHPGLWEELAGKNEVVGSITGADISRDDFFVDHGGKQPALYGGDAIVVLRDSSEIYDHLQHNSVRLSVDDFKDLRNIALLLDYGSAPQLRAAMELARDNKNIHQVALISMEMNLARQASRTVGR